MRDLVRAARAISYAQAAPQFRRRAGVVVSVQSDYTCTVQIAGDATSVSGVRYFAHVSPRPGQQVWLDTDGYDLIVVGVIAGNGGALPAGSWRCSNATPALADATFTKVSFNVVQSDPWTMLAGGSGTDIVVPMSGVYAVAAVGSFANSTAGSLREVLIYSGATILVRTRAEQASGGYPSTNVMVSTAGVRALTAGAVLTMQLYQNSGGTLNLGTGSGENTFHVAYLGPDA